MMKIYSIKDNKGLGFNQLLLANNDLESLRALQDAVNVEEMPGKPQTTLAAHPEDFELYCLGEFNQETGEIVPKLQFLQKAIDLKVQKK